VTDKTLDGRINRVYHDGKAFSWRVIFTVENAASANKTLLVLS